MMSSFRTRRRPRQTLRFLFLAVGISTSTLIACGPGDGSELDERGRPLEYPWAPGIGSKIGSAVFEPTYEDIAIEFLEPFCADCHAGPGSSDGLDLTLERAYDEMVDVPALQNSSLDLVEPGDPENSYLIIKMVGGARMSGRIMPRGRPARPESEIDIIRAWIADGAPRN